MRNRFRNRCCETWKNQNQHPKKTQLIDFRAKTWDTAASFMQSFFKVLVERRLYVFSMLNRFCSQVANKGWWSMLPSSSMKTRSHNPNNVHGSVLMRNFTTPYLCPSSLCTKTIHFSGHAGLWATQIPIASGGEAASEGVLSWRPFWKFFKGFWESWTTKILCDIKMSFKNISKNMWYQ